MAAASNKPGAVHYSLIFFVITTVVAGIIAYMNNRDYNDRATKIAEVETKNGQLEKTIKTQDDKIQSLNNIIGHKFETVENAANPADPATVIGALKKDMGDYGRDVAGQTVAETLKKTREAADAATSDRDSKIATVKTLEKDLKDQSDRLNQQVDTHRKAQEKAEADYRTVITDRDERLAVKDKEITGLKANLNDLTGELLSEKEAREKKQKDYESKISQLEQRIDFLRDKLDELENVSFEVGDGFIRRVEQTTRTVFINVGSADNLKERTTFSVYSKTSAGIGRDAADVKGKIRVVKVTGPHMSEALILEDDLARPIVQGDLIYTPLWSPGLQEKVSIIGWIDLDNDGRSDREELKNIIQDAGAVIDNEVDDEGARFPEKGKITVETRFLVQGPIAELDKLGSDEERQKVGKIRDHLTEMIKEARTSGVRIIKLNDFLAHIGYHAKRRTFLPGQERPYTLKAGAASGSLSEAQRDRTSSGSTSQLFTTPKGKSAPQATSSGQTSGAFKGK